MIRTDKDFQSYKDNDKPGVYFGISTDDKPLTTVVNGHEFPVVNGSSFVEIDTATIYIFDEEGKVWNSMGSGSGSGALASLSDVNISNPTDGQTLVYNATSGKW